MARTKKATREVMIAAREKRKALIKCCQHHGLPCEGRMEVLEKRLRQHMQEQKDAQVAFMLMAEANVSIPLPDMGVSVPERALKWTEGSY